MNAKPNREAAGKPAEAAPGLRLNRRMKDILATGLLPSLSPSALTVLAYGAAYGEFTSCKVFLGAKTIAKITKWHRESVRRGIAELLDVGFLVLVTEQTARKAAVYRLGLDREKIAAARERAAAVGQRRRKSDEQRAAEAAAKRQKSEAGEGAHGCVPRGLTGESPGDSWVSPQGAHGCVPNLSSSVPSSLRERYAGGRSKRRPLGLATQEHELRLQGAKIRRAGA